MVKEIRSSANVDRARQVWQPGWQAETIVSEAFWLQKVEYIHQNPCRKGLVQSPGEWPYSLAAYWMNDEAVCLPIAEIGWDDQ